VKDMVPPPMKLGLCSHVVGVIISANRCGFRVAPWGRLGFGE
jgi:hypothetical protein